MGIFRKKEVNYLFFFFAAFFFAVFFAGFLFAVVFFFLAAFFFAAISMEVNELSRVSGKNNF